MWTVDHIYIQFVIFAPLCTYGQSSGEISTYAANHYGQFLHIKVSPNFRLNNLKLLKQIQDKSNMFICFFAYYAFYGFNRNKPSAKIAREDIGTILMTVASCFFSFHIKYSFLLGISFVFGIVNTEKEAINHFNR